MIISTLYILICLCLLPMTPAYVKQSTPETALQNTSPSYCYFTPPQGWEIADPKSLSPRVKIAFLKKVGSGFCPSMNLAIEETSVSLQEYLKAVKSIHEQDRSNRWRQLGKVHTQAGLAQLTEIDSKTEWGAVRILQLILLKEERAYVLTASALKEDFSDYYREIQSAFRSLTLSSDLFGNIPQTEKREMLKSKQHQLLQAAEEVLGASPEIKNLLESPEFQEKHWLPFQQAVIDSFTDMGAFWQALLLGSTQDQLQSLTQEQTR
jgi:hypothetical protein